MSDRSTGASAGRPRPTSAAPAGRGWRAVDLITLAVLGVAFGVAFWGFDNALYGPILKPALSAFPPAKELLLGVWLIPCVVGMALVRRPGAALFVELIAANLELMLGNEWVAGVLVSALLQAAGVEIVAALVRWRRFDTALAVAGGMLAALIEIVAYEWWLYVPEYSWTWKWVYLACGIASGAVAGVIGLALVRALAAAGVLDAFPAGRERHAAAAGTRADDPFADAR